MDKLWKPIALGKLSELEKRADEIKSADEIYMAVDKLDIPDKLKLNVMRRLLGVGIALSPVPGFAVFTPASAIASAIDQIRDYEEEA